MRIVGCPVQPGASSPQPPGPVSNPVAAALDAVCGARLETYEQLMQGFTYLQPGDVTQAIATPAQPNEDSVLRDSEGSVMTTFHRVLSLLPTQPQVEDFDCEEEDLDLDISAPSATASEELEEEVLGEGVCINRLDSASSTAVSLVKFDNFVSFTASGEESDEENCDERDPDADEDDSQLYSSSYTASFASAAAGTKQPDQQSSGGQSEQQKSSAVGNTQKKPRKSKVQKNLCNEKKKLLGGGSVVGSSAGASIVFPHSHSLLSSGADQLATILSRYPQEHQSVDDLLEMVAASGLEADWFVEEDVDACPAQDDGDVVESEPSEPLMAISHTQEGPLQEDASRTRRSQGPPEAAVTLAPGHLPQGHHASSEVADALILGHNAQVHHQESLEQCEWGHGSVLPLAGTAPGSQELPPDHTLDEPNPGEAECQENLSEPATTQRCLPFSSKGPLTPSQEVAEEANLGSDEVEAFCLDEHFDYDNVQLTAKFSAAELRHLQGFVNGQQQENTASVPGNGSANL